MSDLRPTAQELDEDLRLLMHDAFFPTEAVKERVWGCDSGVGRTVEESRDRYRVPIVEAFQASGAPTLAEFPERVRFLADAYYTLLHERDMAKAEANRYHAELETLRESEHNARLQVQETAAVNANLTAERDRLIREAALGPDTEKPLREEARQLRAERDRYKALAEQQSATVAEGAKTIGEVRAELAATRKAHAEMTAAHAKAVAALNTGSLAESKASRDSLAGRVAELVKENDEMRRGIRRLCRILGKAMAGDL